MSEARGNPPSGRPPRNPPWSNEELLLAMDLYVRRGWLDDRHEEVMELSRLLNRLAEDTPTATFRNPNGVSMKLANFAGIDPDHQGVGLRGAGRRDRAIWERFTHHRDQLAREAMAIRIRDLDREEEEPRASREVADAEHALDELAGRRPGGQGFHVSPEGRRAIEAQAMALAEQHYQGQGWQVENVSTHASFDLRCTRGDHEMHVEVKGTQSDGRQILLTRNEVRHARDAFPQVALFVVAQIRLDRGEDGSVTARGGTVMVHEPWSIDEAGLAALAYEYRIP